MIPIKEAADRLGLSVDQLRRRLRDVTRELDGQIGARVARGPHGQLLLAPELVDLIGAIETEARQLGVSFAAALSRRLAQGWDQDNAMAHQAGQVGEAELGAQAGATTRQPGANDPQASEILVLARVIVTGASLVAGSILVAGILIALALRA